MNRKNNYLEAKYDSFDNCPDWVCGANNVPYDYVYALMTILLSLPYLIFIWKMRGGIKVSFENSLGCFILAGCLMGYILYCGLVFYLFIGSSTPIVAFIGAAAYGPILPAIGVVVLMVLGAIVLGVLGHFHKN